MAKRAAIHDRFFKKIFSDARAARELVGLAATVSGRAGAAFGLRSFRLVEETERRGRQTDVRTDLLFEALHGDERVLVYVLYEHKATAEWDSVFQVLRYTRTAVYALKYYVDRKDPEQFEQTLSSALSLPRLPNVTKRLRDEFQTIVEYVFAISTEKQIEAILKVIERTAGREVAMTAAESLRQQGREQGIELGRQDGQREALVRQISKKFGITDRERKLIENVVDLERLAAALDEIVVADTKEQVLRHLG